MEKGKWLPGGVSEADLRASKEMLPWFIDATLLIADCRLPPFAAQVVDPNERVNFVELYPPGGRDDSFSLKGDPARLEGGARLAAREHARDLPHRYHQGVGVQLGPQHRIILLIILFTTFFGKVRWAPLAGCCTSDTCLR